VTADASAELRAHVERHNQGLLKAYVAHPPLMREHYGIEQTVMAGGYGYRQILELVQNGADAILEAHENGLGTSGRNRVHVMLRGNRLYVANTGAPLSHDGISALLSSHSSPKRGNQIGRFGLGFKSLLALGGQIDLFTRRAGALRLDPDRCRRLLRDRFNVQDAPGLRLTWPLDEQERRQDVVLAELGWAETVVRVGVSAPGTLDHLRQEIRGFPPEFLLFFPVPVELTLDDGEKPARELSVGHEPDAMALNDGKDSARWRVFRREVRIAESRALADATHIHARDTVPLAWAVPVEGRREEAGRFWAFFPTHTPTFVRGILNAPWKLNSDRNAIIGGEWNHALMAQAAVLIAESLPALRTDADPALPLDAFPRQLDRRDDDAAPLVEALWSAIEQAPVVPDATGALRKGAELLRHPREREELALQWQELASQGVASQLVHPKCHDRLRSARLDALARRLDERPSGDKGRNLKACSIESWFEVIASPEPGRCLQVLELARAVAADSKGYEWAGARDSLCIVPDDSGQLRKPTELVLAPSGSSVGGLAIVEPRLQQDPQARAILTSVLDIRPLGDDVWETLLQTRIDEVPHHASAHADEAWQSFWTTLRAAPAVVRDGFLLANRWRVRIRRNDGLWVQPQDALLPGSVVAADDKTASSRVLADLLFHVGDRDALAKLGARQAPEGTEGPSNFASLVARDRSLSPWREHCRRLYKQMHSNSASWDYLQPVSIVLPAGWRLLPLLEGAAAAKLTVLFLQRLGGGEFQGRVKFGHSTMNSYPKIEVAHPLAWFLLTHGRVAIGSHVVRLGTIADRRSSPAMALLPEWNDWLRASIERVVADWAPARPTDGEVRNLWLGVIEVLTTPSTVAEPVMSAVWRDAAVDGVVPPALPGASGPVLLSDMYVTTSVDLALRVRETGRLVVALDEPTLEKWRAYGARSLAEFVKPEWTSETGPSATVTSLVPELADVLDADALRATTALDVRGLRLRLENESQPLSCLMWEGMLLLDREQLGSLPRAERLRLLVAEAATAGLLSVSADEAVEVLGNSRVEQIRATIRLETTLAGRLFRAVGGRRDPLEKALGSLAGLDVVRDSDGLKLAELVLAQFGTATLVMMRDVLEAEGFRPPARWSGHEGRAFVAEIGFPESYAIAPEARRDAEELITGPIELPTLHDFQQEVFAGVEKLLRAGKGRRRAVVSLPTGGGKTRVTVEAAVRLVLTPDSGSRSVLWVAQTDELCEQAVQAFRQVWLNVGAPRTELRVVRLWGGSPNPAPPENGRPVAVVASIQTLNSRFSASELAWLRKPGLVVVDECHHAITPSYTNLLRWLDADASRSAAAASDEPPMLGLSATPFRTHDDESQRLARRFDSRWLPEDQESLYERLRCQGVLAQAIYEPLQSGAALLNEELERLDRLHSSWEGLDMENLLEAINQRLAGDRKRNELLVDFLVGVAERSVLFFANSVLHAQEMALRLNYAGVSAAAVSGATPASARRNFLDSFQSGKVKVLCNHSVLTTGFDAPRTDLVLIARQVFSPVQYMQMVGRGLRGERNGGTPRCRIVTVLDNLGRFQERHPYHYCKDYFATMQRQSSVAGSR
jgi:superfamily II DNA or RNA helicase